MKTAIVKSRKRARKTSQMERTTVSVLDATVELLGDVGYRRLTVELISQRSGIARSTIYRHWRNVAELAIAAFDHSLGPNPETPDEGDIRSDLLSLYEGLSKSLERSIWGKTLPALIEASHNDEKFKGMLEGMAHERREAARHMLQRAVDRGELKPETNFEWLLDSISGPLYYRLLVTGTSTREVGLVEQLVDSNLTPWLIQTA